MGSREKIILDQVIRQKDPIYAQEFGEHGLGINPSVKAFTLWAKAPHIDKPVVLYGLSTR